MNLAYAQDVCDSINKTFDSVSILQLYDKQKYGNYRKGQRFGIRGFFGWCGL